MVSTVTVPHRVSRGSAAVLFAEPSRMTKRDVLVYLADVGEADAAEMASALGVPTPPAQWRRFRLVRQHLATAPSIRTGDSTPTS